jgi:hypothetical protein
VTAGRGTTADTAELAEHPGADQVTEAGLAPVDLRVRVPAKTRLDLPLQGHDLGVQCGDRPDQRGTRVPQQAERLDTEMDG